MLFFRLATLCGGMTTCNAWNARRHALLLDSRFISMHVLHVPALSIIAKKTGRSRSGETICLWILRSHKKAGVFNRNVDLSPIAKRMLQQQPSLVF
jgi:hypothetical protein